MTDTSEGAPAPVPKKRSLFKRAAWQDEPKKEGKDEDIFSHANEFNSIVAEQNRREAEKRKKAVEERKRKHSGPTERKRRRISSDHDEPISLRSGSGSAARATRTSSKAYVFIITSNRAVFNMIVDAAERPSRPRLQTPHQTRSLHATTHSRDQRPRTTTLSI